jgi:hypothetical protein
VADAQDAQRLADELERYYGLHEHAALLRKQAEEIAGKDEAIEIIKQDRDRWFAEAQGALASADAHASTAITALREEIAKLRGALEEMRKEVYSARAATNERLFAAEQIAIAEARRAALTAEEE